MADKRKPVYLIAGGRRPAARRNPDPLFAEALALAGALRPSVAYIGAASGDNALFRAMISRVLRRAGAGTIGPAPLCGRRADPAKAARVIEESRIVFFSGGDVEEGIRVLVEKGMTGFLLDQYRQGKVFFGVSAGSIMLAKKWVRWRGPEADAAPELFPCLGVAKIYCDTHDEEDGWEELRTLARLVKERSVFYGIPSGTALVTYPDGRCRAAGGAVHCFRRKGAQIVQVECLTP
jgi:peptidase E